MTIHRTINKVIIHCSASGPKTTLDDIKRWHKERGWVDIGYHYVILSDGIVKMGRPLDMVGAHCKNHNYDSIGICLVGGDDGKINHPFSNEQFISLKLLLEGVNITVGEHLKVYGHKDFDPLKTCPCFEVLEKLGKKLCHRQ